MNGAQFHLSRVGKDGGGVMSGSSPVPKSEGPGGTLIVVWKGLRNW
jgi:hypothetical protein